MTQFGPFCEQIGLHLEPFQRRIAKAVEGTERELVVLLPRGQGKTTLLAAVALHHLRALGQPHVTRRGAFTDARGPPSPSHSPIAA